MEELLGLWTAQQLQKQHDLKEQGSSDVNRKKELKEEGNNGSMCWTEMYIEEIPAPVVSLRHSVKETDILHTSDIFFERLHFLGLFNSHLALSHPCPAKRFLFFSWKELQLPWRNKQKKNSQCHGNCMMHNMLFQQEESRKCMRH